MAKLGIEITEESAEHNELTNAQTADADESDVSCEDGKGGARKDYT